MSDALAVIQNLITEITDDFEEQGFAVFFPQSAILERLSAAKRELIVIDEILYGTYTFSLTDKGKATIDEVRNENH